MADADKGVLVRQVEPTSNASAGLSKGDVVLSFDGQPVACDGTVPFRIGERIGFSHLVSSKFAGETATLRVWHDGAARTVAVKLSVPKRLIPVHTAGASPSYYIIAGLVFTPVTVPYLRSEYGAHYDYDAPVRRGARGEQQLCMPNLLPNLALLRTACSGFWTK
jgi:hypothetical protein